MRTGQENEKTSTARAGPEADRSKLLSKLTQDAADLPNNRQTQFASCVQRFVARSLQPREPAESSYEKDQDEDSSRERASSLMHRFARRREAHARCGSQK